MSIEDGDRYRDDFTRQLRRIKGSPNHHAIREPPTFSGPKDRDLARRLHSAIPELHRNRRQRSQLWQPVAAILAVTVGAIVLAAPPMLTSRCDRVAWNIQPIACWHHSWAALRMRVAGNLEVTRGYPLIIVQMR